MIVVNRIGENIVVSCRDKEYSVLYNKERFDKLMKISEESQTISRIAELNALLEEAEEICKNDFKERVEAFHSEIYVAPVTQKFYLKIGDVVSKIPMPDPLVRRLKESLDKEINSDPIIKCWKRFLRNKKANNPDFARRFCEYIDMIYVRPDEVNRLMEEEGLGYGIATEMASTYEVKVTQEGLIACYKTSQEIDYKFVPGEDGEPQKVNRYTKTFDENTGEILGDNRDDIPAEDRLFQPLIMGNGGDAFYCEGPSGFSKPGHFIKVGCLHRLPDWSHVNCDDHTSCVKGLHVGGLGYINQWGGEIHTCLVDPMHIGAIPDYSGALAIRVLQYFVDGSLSALNHSIYHSSEYAKQTDEEWEKVAEEILEKHGTLKEEIDESATTINNL